MINLFKLAKKKLMILKKYSIDMQFVILHASCFKRDLAGWSFQGHRGE